MDGNGEGSDGNGGGTLVLPPPLGLASRESVPRQRIQLGAAQNSAGVLLVDMPLAPAPPLRMLLASLVFY
jgi:hypothetical protein